MTASDTETRLASWLEAQLPGARNVRVDGLGTIDTGHSAETLLASVHWRSDGVDEHREVVLRLRPPSPGLLEPYDLGRQFAILRCLEDTPVRAPRALWHDPSGDVLGREFYVMERLPGTVYEYECDRGDAATVDANDPSIRPRCEGVVDQLAAIHSVDVEAFGLNKIGSGDAYLERELGHWISEIERVKRGPLPALEHLAAALQAQQPEPCPRITLVHGDPKVGNFAFVGTEVTAVFDWEMATIGDPLADIGWLEVLWDIPGLFTSHPAAPSVEEFVGRWEAATGIEAKNRPWYRAFQGFKMAVIQLVGGHLFDAGHTDDLRFFDMSYAVRPMTQAALAELGINEAFEAGPVVPRKERALEVRARLGL